MRIGCFDDLKLVEWPPSTLEMQKNWIGRSIGAEVEFGIAGINGTIRIFTTRPDTLFGATYMVLAPEHPLVEVVTHRRPSVRLSPPIARRRPEKAISSGRNWKRRRRESLPAAMPSIRSIGERLPIWIADYVLMGYGTGAIMAVPGARRARLGIREDLFFADSRSDCRRRG